MTADRIKWMIADFRAAWDAVKQTTGGARCNYLFAHTAGVIVKEIRELNRGLVFAKPYGEISGYDSLSEVLEYLCDCSRLYSDDKVKLRGFPLPVNVVVHSPDNSFVPHLRIDWQGLHIDPHRLVEEFAKALETTEVHA